MTGWAESSTAAKVGDWQVTVEDVDAALGQKLYELDKKRYQLRVMEVQNRLNQYLLESEAKAKSTDISELIKGAINERVQKVSDEDAKSFMATNAGRIPEGVTEAQVKGFLLEQERKRVLGGYIRTLQEKYGAEILLEEPLAPRVEIRGSQELSKGPSDAKITIVEFSDFECPFCSKVQGTLDEVLKAYPEDVRLVYRHFPLSFHRNALTASEATMCAQDQGKFWPMHDEIFSDQKNIAVDDLKKHAETIGLEMTEFNNCLDQRTHKEYVTADVNEASRIGVSATPTFYVNGVKLEGGYDMSNFSKAIDRELKKM
ncbi:MAG: thioredoxin domain-containing protein [Candidatus Sedimenticola sp. (ex Thyasira tokunagai)]